ncbi:uncharacterized protein C8Q71DRAFT_860855 [Rhodofomes roseus]|uniref:Uncharacterized protein n=1 Tax=Rhodofomes roseus TaxID=34475 RepID=A0ABQ8K5U4_9APHY|nr:uncharacterized protein C8Q71DRAFT_860855 [Rhodofomes roseus]KAH9832458.1 hypothetical protein C8Q71DRAFT_860855 [Rhodofomes roseus]
MKARKATRTAEINKDAQQGRTTKRTSRKEHHPYIPLPKFSELDNLPASTITQVKIAPKPIFGGGRGLTWVADERPASQLKKGSLISLSTASETSGIGKLSAISDLRRHWVTFTVTGADLPCNLRVPIPWSSLDDLESFTHQRNYFDLNNSPPPHTSFHHIPAFNNEEENPYEFEITDNEIDSLEDRIAQITNATTQTPTGSEETHTTDHSRHNIQRTATRRQRRKTKPLPANENGTDDS